MNKSKIESIQELYNEIFGNRISNFNFLSPISKENTFLETTIPREIILDNSYKYKCKKECKSKCNMQDVPFFENLESVEWMIIAEAPGRQTELNINGRLNSVFGWADLFIKGKAPKDVTNYFNYILCFLKIKSKELYITDAVKCFTDNKAKNGEFTLNNAFEICSNYLEREILILKPQNIIWLPSSIKQLVKSDESNKFFQSIINNNPDQDWLNNINHIFHPHFSKQNTSKIPVVIDLLEAAEKINPILNTGVIAKPLNEIYRKMREIK